jgi:beta-galactosidase
MTLVGYDVIRNTPFDVNIKNSVLFGSENRLDVHITDPVGNFFWNDNILMRWGDNLIPAVHGFGGITSPVTFIATDDVVVE